LIDVGHHARHRGEDVASMPVREACEVARHHRSQDDKRHDGPRIQEMVQRRVELLSAHRDEDDVGVAGDRGGANGSLPDLLSLVAVDAHDSKRACVGRSLAPDDERDRARAA
jgi:hypothetical protein